MLTDNLKDAMIEWFKPRTIFALMFYAGFLWMVCFTDKEVPEVLIGMVNLLLGFYFGQKSKKNNGGGLSSN